MFPVHVNHINGVMVSLLASSVVDCGFVQRLKLVFAASPLKTQH